MLALSAHPQCCQGRWQTTERLRRLQLYSLRVSLPAPYLAPAEWAFFHTDAETETCQTHLRCPRTHPLATPGHISPVTQEIPVGQGFLGNGPSHHRKCPFPKNLEMMARCGRRHGAQGVGSSRLPGTQPMFPGRGLAEIVTPQWLCAQSLTWPQRHET